MKTYITISKKWSSRWARLISVPVITVLIASLMLPAEAVSQLSAVNLGAAGTFRILAESGVTGGAAATITGDIGVSPAAAATITGFGLIMDAGNTFSTSSRVTGRIYAADYTDPTPANLTAAVSAKNAAYTDAAGRTPVPTGTFLDRGAGEIGGLTLAPGLYKWTTAVLISNDLTLSGTASDVWIFQIAGTLGIASGKQVILSGGAVASNIFWQVSGQVTLGTTAAMKGVIMGATGVAMLTGATLDGRAFAGTSVTLDGNTVLPVELVSFTAASNRMSAELRWSTATETNNYGFEIQRRNVKSSNVAPWQKVGFMSGAGTSNRTHEYNYTDLGLAAGRYAYRVKQIDNDGLFKYSSAAEVEIGLAAKEFTLNQNYPNPFNPSTMIEFTLARNDRAVVKVFNILGQDVATLFDGNADAGKLYQVRFDASNMSSGMYYVRIATNGQSRMQKIVYMK